MGNLRTLSAGAALAGVLVWVGAAHAADPVVNCQEAKLKAQGKLQCAANRCRRGR
jgi:hypothetical protein